MSRAGKQRFHAMAFAVALAAMSASCGSEGFTAPPPEELVIVTDSLPPATVGEPYSAGVDAEGGADGYTWRVTGGALPLGLEAAVEDLSDSDLVISGTPEDVGTSTFTLLVESGDGQTATVTLELEVLPQPSEVSVKTLVLPPGLVDGIYGSELRAEGGDFQTYTWTLVSGSLPPGLELTSGGSIEGIPTTPDTTTLTVEVESGGFTARKTFTLAVVPDRPGDYQITVLPVVAIPSSIRPHVEEALERWEAALSGDLGAVAIPETFFGPEHCGGFGESADGTSVDDILMLVNIAPIDGAGKVLGRAGPCALRGSNDLPFVGILTLDSDDLTPLAGTRTLTHIITHEMGHILGVGSLWERKGLVANPDSADPRFTGPAAVEEYHALGGTGNVPVEPTGAGEGTSLVHWSEAEFDTELMTGFVEDIGVPQPLSRMTIGSLADLGYAVDYSGADPYSLAATLRASGDERPADLGYDELYRGPVRVLEPDGRVHTIQLR